MKIRTYEELIQFETFEERFEYLKLGGEVGLETFGMDRFLNQALYRSKIWRNEVRPAVILRDNGCDLAIEDRQIYDSIIIHHMNPITLEDIENNDPKIYCLDFLVCTSLLTHNAIHYGDSSILQKDYEPRRPGDTKLW